MRSPSAPEVRPYTQAGRGRAAGFARPRPRARARRAAGRGRAGRAMCPRRAQHRARARLRRAETHVTGAQPALRVRFEGEVSAGPCHRQPHIRRVSKRDGLKMRRLPRRRRRPALRVGGERQQGEKQRRATASHRHLAPVAPGRSPGDPGRGRNRSVRGLSCWRPRSPPPRAGTALLPAARASATASAASAR